MTGARLKGSAVTLRPQHYRRTRCRALAALVLEEWIDAQEREGRRPGALWHRVAGGLSAD